MENAIIKEEIMLITTTNTVEDHKVTNYRGIVFGEVITGVNFFKDIGASFRDLIGGRSKGYEEELMHAREEALSEMGQRARSLGADAVIAAKVDYEVLGQNGSMMMVIASGTAVNLEKVL